MSVETVQVRYEADTGGIERGNQRIEKSFGVMKRKADSVNSSGMRRLEKELAYLEKQLRINTTRMDELRRKAELLQSPSNTSKEAVRLDALTAKLVRFQQQQELLKERIAAPVSPDVTRETAAMQKYAEQMDQLEARIAPIRDQIRDIEAFQIRGGDPEVIAETIRPLKAEYDALVEKIDNISAAYAAMEDKVTTKQELAKAAEKDKEKLEQVGFQIKKLQAEIRLLQDQIAAKGLIGGTERDRAALVQLDIQMQNTELQAQRVQDRIAVVNAKLAEGSVQANKFGGALVTAGRRTKHFSGVLGSNMNVLTRYARAFATAIRRIFVVTAVFMLVKKFSDYLFSGMKANDEFNRSLNAIKVNLLVAFQPIITHIVPLLQRLIGWLARALAAIAAFISVLFGSSYAANRDAAKSFYDSAQAANAVGGGAKKMADEVEDASDRVKGNLAPFDLFNDISKETVDGLGDLGGGGGGGGIPLDFTFELPDVSKAEKAAQNIRDFFGWLFEDGFGGAVEKWFTKALPAGWKIILDGLKTGLCAVGIFALNNLRGIWEKIKEIFSPIGEWFSDRGRDIKTFFLDTIPDFFKEKFGEAKTKVKEVFGGIGGWFSERGNDIKTFFLDAVPGFFMEKFGEAHTSIVEVFGPIGAWFGDKWSEIKRVYSPVADWFKDKFESAAENIRNAIAGLPKYFTNIGELMKKAMIGAINWIIDKVESGINALISAVNSVTSKLPFGIPQIPLLALPRLAKGGLAYGETLALVGDNKGARVGNPEVIAPLDKLQDMFMAAIMQHNISSPGGGFREPIEIRMTLDDGTTLVRMLVDPTNQTAKQLGYRAVFVPV